MPYNDSSRVMDLWNMCGLLRKLGVIEATDNLTINIMDMLSDAINKDRMRYPHDS
jgi:hypothetical protein